MSFSEFCIYQSADQSINVYQKGNHRILSFDGKIEQSRIHIHKPHQPLFSYIRGMLLAALFVDNPRKAIVLGIGGGSLVQAVAKLWPKCQIIATDIDQQVLDVLPRFFQLDRVTKLHLNAADAEQYVWNMPTQIDLIFVDLYDQQGMLSFQVNEAYVRQCASCLSDQGVLVFNLWADNYLSRYFVQDVLPQLFDHNHFMSVSIEGGNLLVFIFSQSLFPLKRQQVRNKLENIEDRLEHSFQTEVKSLFEDNPVFFNRN